jgi:NAD(P)-dependent dehydrogenase (short-subunit alcohol dehydrogenase family)
MDEWDWHRTLDANLGAAFFAIQVVGRVMRAAAGGTMVNLVTLPGAAERMPGSAAFAAAQAGILSLTRSAALELAPFNIRLNAVCLPEPGMAALPAVFQPAPPGYSGEQSDPVELALFLCSQAAAGISGQVFGAALD